MLRISVIIPSKNRAHTLTACLNSIIAQTYPATEIIVVDDGSTDDTKELVESFDRRIVRYSRLPQGQGAQSARNHGIKIAAHEWIAFQDSDDLWLINKLENQVCALQAHDYNPRIVVHGNGFRRDAVTLEQSAFDVPKTEGDCFHVLLRRPAPLFPTLLVSAQALEQAGYLDENCPSYQEWDTAIRLARQCRFIHIEQPLFVWVWHGSDQISKDEGRALRGWSYVLDRHKSDFIQHYGARAWREAKLEQYLQAISAGLWLDAQVMMSTDEKHFSFALARLIARIHRTPRGTLRLLRWAVR